MSTEFLRAEAELVLTEARKVKSKRTKSLGSPIQLAGIALSMQIRDGIAWIGDNTTVAKNIDLETGKVRQIYAGHTGPVSALAFCDKVQGSGDGKILVTGSWDKTIKLWNTDTKELISSTPAHSDFVKSFLVIPSLQLLISGGSDKIVRYWDLSTAVNEHTPLTFMGSISSHTRPVECIDGKALSSSSAILYTADTMGVIKVWDLVKESTAPSQWRSTLKNEYRHHRTGINEMLYGDGQLWTASSDDTAQVLPLETLSSVPCTIPSITHPVAVRTILPLTLTDLAEPYLITGAGDVIRVYDISSLKEPEIVNEVDAHWHDVTALRLWIRKFVGADNKTRVEPYIVSTSLDGTIRKWRLSDLLNPAPVPPNVDEQVTLSAPSTSGDDPFKITEDEERELAELLGSD